MQRPCDSCAGSQANCAESCAAYKEYIKIFTLGASRKNITGEKIEAPIQEASGKGRGCATCRWLFFKCKERCEECKSRVLGERYKSMDELLRGYTETKCKCIECFNERTGEFRFYEEDERLMELFAE